MKPNTEIGQHLLIDQEVVKKMVEVIPPGEEVIEIGAGPGQITEALLNQGSRVVAIEIDRQFAPFLSSLGQRYPAKLEVVYGNALDQNWRRLTDKKRKEGVWLIGSLPYHITEPLMATIASLPIKGAVFLVGVKFASEIKASQENSPRFGKLTLLVNTFFHPKAISEVNKSCFYPEPRTNSEIIILTPRDESDYLENKTLFILRELFLGASRSPLVKNALKEALIRYEEFRIRQGKGKKEGNRFARRRIKEQLRVIAASSGKELISVQERKGKHLMTQNEARRIIATLNLPETLLNKPLEQLNNLELKELFYSLREEFGSPFK